MVMAMKLQQKWPRKQKSAVHKYTTNKLSCQYSTKYTNQNVPMLKNCIQRRKHTQKFYKRHEKGV
jgi:hypothetical protein